MEIPTPTRAEVCFSLEYQQYQLIFDEEIAYLYAREEIMERRLREAYDAHGLRRAELKTMPYHVYLHTPEWSQRAAHARARDGYRCRLCNSDDQLDVHHRTYERRGAEAEDDLTALCRRCHSLFHEWADLAG
jgi:hypothetical protein